MKQQPNYETDKQQGIALPIVMVILVLAALIVLYLANTSRKEQRISADQYRTEQSFNAAMSGLDWAIDHYNAEGLDVIGNDGIVDYGPSLDTNADPCQANCVSGFADCPKRWCIGSDASTDDPSVLSASGDLIVKSHAFYCSVDDLNFWSTPDLCTSAPNIGAKKVGVVSIGYSDDNTARRVITVVLAGAPLLPPTGPGQPLTTKGGVGFTGNMTVINRYFNVNIMSGGPINLSSSAMTTYVAGDGIPLGEDRLGISRFEMTHVETDREINGEKTSMSGSTNTRGNNADALENVPLLANLSPDEYFEYFLNANKEDIKAAAGDIGQNYPTCSDVPDDDPPLSGLIWINGDCTSNDSSNFGTLENPAAVFVDGDLDLGGNQTLYGLFYITGDLSITGGPTVKGSIIVEGAFPADKAGTLDLVYDPVAVAPEAGVIGRRSIVAGTWKDWGN